MLDQTERRNRRGWGAGVAALALLLAGAVAGCGDAGGKASAAGSGDHDALVPTAATPTGNARNSLDLPRCGAVWTMGHKLPAGYHGCSRGRVAVAADAQSCSSGQSLVRFGDRFFAVRGGPVQRVADLDRSKRYQQVLRSCTG